MATDLYNILTQGGKFKMDIEQMISLGYLYPAVWNYLVAGHKPVLGTGASSGKTIQNDPTVTFLQPSLTPAVATLTSDDANDAFGGLGAQLALVSGVGGDGFYRSELVALAGTDGADTVNTYYIIDDAVRLLEGASGQQGTITVAIDGNSMGAITPALGAMLTAHWLTPINYYFYPTSQVESGTSNIDVQGVVQFNVFGGGSNQIVANTFYADNSVSEILYYPTPFPFPPGTYVRFDAYGNSGDAATFYGAGRMIHVDLVKDVRGHQISAPPGTVYDAVNLDDLPPFWFEGN